MLLILTGQWPRTTSVCPTSTFQTHISAIKDERTIAVELGALDNKIKLNRRMNVTLEAMVRELFPSWFVDSAPVRANLNGRLPSGLDETTAALFPHQFQDSELGRIPQRWSIGSIYEIVDVIYGAPFASKLFNSNGEGRYLIRIRDLANESPAAWTTEVHSKE